MDSNELRDNLTTLTDSELVTTAQKYICLSLANLNNPDHHSHMLLNIVYAEFAQRGKELLYDKVYESVCRYPQKCHLLLPPNCNQLRIGTLMPLWGVDRSAIGALLIALGLYLLWLV